MPKAQMHFEADVELKQHWKAFFSALPRGSESRVLVELMRNFLAGAKKEAQSGPEEKPLDSAGDRSGVVEQSGVEILGSSERVSPTDFCLPEDYGE
jgi:hypothetical protein